MLKHKKPGFATLAIHAGASPDPTTGARIVPIYQTASFVLEDVDKAAAMFALEAPGYKYSRTGNPTITALEERVAILEGGTAAVATSSGHAAQLLAFFSLLQPGDQFIAADKLYGGTIAQLGETFQKFGWIARWANPEKPETFELEITPKTKAIYIESIANPAGSFVDIAKIAAIAKKHNIPLIVDNTLATPYLIRPFDYGANIVVHSATKFLGGHGNSLGGIVVDGGNFNWVKDDRFPLLSQASQSYPDIIFAETFGNYAFASSVRTFGMQYLGPCLSPFNAFLILMGIETLPLRMQCHCDNALAIATFLEQHPKVQWVRYGHLKNDTQFTLAQKYSPKGAGAVFTFGLKGGYEAAVNLIPKLKIFSHLANIGDTRSLIIHPASTTHKQLNDKQMHAAGLGKDTIRLSIGIENKEDLIADIETALGT